MATLSWLHLTDLHQGLTGQHLLWPAVKDAFLRDLTALHARSGPWDVVLFTGDLTQSGQRDEFGALEKKLDALDAHLASLGSRPAFVCVPGNHDLTRPKGTATVRVLERWHDLPDVRKEFWEAAPNEYRATVEEAFAEYQAFALRRTRVPAGAKLRRGVLPGDVSVSFEKEGMRVALVGLNSAFLQLQGGDYTGKLDVDTRQVQAVCGGDDASDDHIEWLKRHDVALLLTHHPTSWLHPRARESFFENICPPGLFLAHLFGHMHEAESAVLSIAGAHPRRVVQGPSLFGLDTWGDGSRPRIHGYMAGRVEIDGRAAQVRLWPRALSKTRAGSWQVVPDPAFELDADGAVTETFPPRHPVPPKSVPGVARQPDIHPLPHAPQGDRAPPAVRTQGGPSDINSMSGPLFQRTHEALLSAFPRVDVLTRLVQFALSENLAEIASGNLSAMVFDLLVWARSRGRLGELIEGALRSNPDSPELRRLAADLGTETPAKNPRLATASGAAPTWA